MDSVNITETIINTINSLFNNLFSSVDNNVYAVLDDITFINSNIINDDIISRILETSTTTGLIVVANALIISLAAFYAVRYLLSSYTLSQVEKPYQFIFKLVIIIACVNCSFTLCEYILNINSFISGSIREVGEYLLKTNISFENLIIKINSIISFQTTLNVFSFDGIIKSFTSIGLLGLLFSYSLRYILIKVFVLMSPFMIITLINTTTSWIFKSWIKSVLSLLLMQSFIALILVLIFATDYSDNNLFTKLIYIGSIYGLMKANSIITQIMGGISTEISNGISGLKSVLK